MEILPITDRGQLAEYFRKDAPLHLYSLGDLDDFYWPRCSYFATISHGQLNNVCLLYRGEGLPILLALGEVNADFILQLMASLPGEIYAHLNPGLEEVFRTAYRVKDYGQHYKMLLKDIRQLSQSRAENVYPITIRELPAVNRLYRESYPENAFDPRMLETGMYFGLNHQDRLASIAGIHVYSPQYRVAALGNITTHPDFRGKGFGRVVTTRLCQELAEKVGLIGLNVKSDNLAAIALYQGLGFRITAEYGEFSLQKGG